VRNNLRFGIVVRKIRPQQAISKKGAPSISAPIAVAFTFAVAIKITFSLAIATATQLHTPPSNKRERLRESSQNQMQTWQKGWAHDTPSESAREQMQLEQKVLGMAARVGLFQMEDTI